MVACPKCNQAINHLAETCQYCGAKDLNKGERLQSDIIVWSTAIMFLGLFFWSGREWMNEHTTTLTVVGSILLVPLTGVTIFSKVHKKMFRISFWYWLVMIIYGVLLAPSLLTSKDSVELPQTYTIMRNYPRSTTTYTKRVGASYVYSQPANSVGVYMKKSKNSRVIDSLRYGTRIRVTKISGKWVEMESQSYKGWILREFIR